MRVTLDVQALQSRAHAERGIGRYVASHAAALVRAGAPVAGATLNPLLPAPRSLPAELAASELVGWATERTYDAIAHEGDFLHHLMSPFEDVRPADGLVAPPAYRRARAIAVTLYDAIPYVMPEHYQRSWWNRQFLRRRAALVQQADVVCAISRSAARDAVDVLELDPARVVVIGASASEHFRPPIEGDDNATVAQWAVPALQRPFVLAVTGDDPRKDPLGLVDAYARLPHDTRRAHQLVLTCTLEPATEQHWREHAARRGLGPDEVVLTGYLDDDALRALYQRCRLFVMNSRREGFGLPVLEAARCGAVAITADNSSLPEVLDEPASLFPTGDTDALAAHIDRALRDERLRQQLAAAGARAAARFSWEAVARATIDAYERTAPTSSTTTTAAPARVARRRVALVGPFAPASSGVADYNERVADALARHTALDCFAEVDPPYERGTTAGRRFAIGTFGRALSPGTYDSVVYTLGNSRFHGQTIERALAYPGVVWLHDACLAGLYLTRAGLYLPGVPTEAIDFDAAEAFMRAALVRCDGDDHAWPGDDWWRPEAWVDGGVLLLGELLRVARAVVVSSEEAKRIVLANGGAGLDVHVVPLAIPSPRPVAAADDDGGGDGAPWVVSLGVVSTVKRIDDLVRAFARVRDRTGARLAVVGNVDLVYANTLLALAEELGVGDDVVVTGLVPAEEYAAWVHRATAVVQLRSRSVGEGSATVTDAIAAAKAVITNVGSTGELPDGVVDRVPVDVDVDALAERLERALLDRDHREALERSAAAFATTHTFDDVARQLVAILAGTAEPSYPAPLAMATA